MAGDLIRTVVVRPTLDNLVVLALIVVIRTFLSITLQLEVEGHWPWQHPDNSGHESRANKGTGRSRQAVGGAPCAAGSEDSARPATGLVVPAGARFSLKLRGEFLGLS